MSEFFFLRQMSMIIFPWLIKYILIFFLHIRKALTKFTYNVSYYQSVYSLIDTNFLHSLSAIKNREIHHFGFGWV